MRRILWRFDDNQQEPEIFVTTRVNYGDGLAGCIAIAAIQEAAEMFSKCRKEAASFLKNMTYVDDALGGAPDKDNVQCISQNMESMIENAGFHFKAMVMTGDPLDEREELQKILGLRWDTEREESALMSSLASKKGANMEDDAASASQRPSCLHK